MAACEGPWSDVVVGLGRRLADGELCPKTSSEPADRAVNPQPSDVGRQWPGTDVQLDAPESDTEACWPNYLDRSPPQLAVLPRVGVERHVAAVTPGLANRERERAFAVFVDVDVPLGRSVSLHTLPSNLDVGDGLRKAPDLAAEVAGGLGRHGQGDDVAADPAVEPRDAGDGVASHGDDDREFVVRLEAARLRVGESRDDDAAAPRAEPDRRQLVGDRSAERVPVGREERAGDVGLTAEGQVDLAARREPHGLVRYRHDRPVGRGEYSSRGCSYVGGGRPPAMDIDHVAFAHEDFDTVVDAFERVGLDPEYGGVHATGTTRMSLLGFPDGSYLELLSTTAEATPDEAGFWPERIAASAGPAAWCIGVDDSREWAKRCIDAGLTVDGPKTAGRERDDGRRVEWDMVFVGGEGERELHPFAITDRTPRERRVTPTESVADGPLSGISEVVLAVSELDHVAERFRRVYGFPTPERWTDEAFGASLATFPGQPVTLAEPADEESWLVDRLRAVGQGPCAYLLGTDDLDAARETYELSPPTAWGTDEPAGTSRRVAWFADDELRQRVGVVSTRP